MSARLDLRRAAVPALAVTVLLCACTAWRAAGAGAAERKEFGLADFTVQTVERTNVTHIVGGEYSFENVPYTFTQAGGHPWGVSFTYRFKTEKVKGGGEAPTQDPKDVVTDLPPGFLGNPNPKAFPQCPLKLLVTSDRKHCPVDTQIGMARLRWFDGEKEELAPFVNVAPEKGQSAEFGLELGPDTALLTAHVVRVREASGAETYGLTVVSNNIPFTELDEVEVTLWGVPADPSHDDMRGLVCGAASRQPGNALNCSAFGSRPGGVAPVPFVTMPTACSAGPLRAIARVDSWEEPGSVREGRYTGYHEATAAFPSAMSGVTGCNLLKFEPTLEINPDTLLADVPVGLGIDLQVPQSEEPGALATPQLRDTTLTLPEGMSISPGIVDGIQACNESGPEGINFTGPESEEKGVNGELQLAPGHCPDASIVGEAEAETPLQAEPVKGHVYLARPGCGNAALGQRPCTKQDAADGNLYQLYLELGGAGALADTGVNLKVRLKTEANPATGQLTTVAQDTPQFPFSELRIRLNGGPRSPLDNPAVCGPAVTTSDLTPWSAPGSTPETPELKSVFMPGTPDATPFRAFEVVGCSSPPGLNPAFLAQMAESRAGSFQPFTMNLTRKDREQYVKGIQIHTPPGLLGMLASVPLCGEAQANEGKCPEASKIGTTRVASGAGSHPFEIEGRVYLTGPYGGAPFGLSIVTNAVAGPFNLGLVIVRARIQVDPENSTLTITTDETGPYAVPQIIFGVPLRLQRVTVNIDRPGFMFNPTNCKAQQITAKISGSQNATATVSSPFTVGSCKSLAFKPSFKVSTSGKTSRAKGASLDAKVSYPKGAMGNDANIAKVKVSLPKQLPSRLTTLQKACPAATFNANPAGCLPASIVGIARASTPLLPVGLSGPVYFVSHGGEAFPSLIVVLQGDGVRVDLTGTTFINKAGITSSTFKTVPDVPVDTFELYLPEGPYSALAANGNLCAATGGTVTVKRKVTQRVHGRTVHRTLTTHKSAPALLMPTEFVAQNGAVLKQSTKIAVSGCGAGNARAARHKARLSRRNGAARAARAQPSGIGQGKTSK
jgi:hypothetical protein